MTFAALALTLLIGLWRLVNVVARLRTNLPGVALLRSCPALLAVVGLWAAYRSVNLPAFADFLIAVEAEMNKVSWPSRSEMFRWSVVVIVMIFSIGLLLAAFDVFWIKFFKCDRRVLRLTWLVIVALGSVVFGPDGFFGRG